MCEPPVYLFWPHTHSTSEQICRSLLSIREVAMGMRFPSVVIPDCIHFFYHVTIAQEHLWNKVCSLFHGLPGSKSGCTTTTSPESFISLKSKCQAGQKSQGRPQGSFCKLSGCSQSYVSCNWSPQRLSTIPCHMAPSQLASSRPTDPSPLALLPLDPCFELARADIYVVLIYVNWLGALIVFGEFLALCHRR